MDEERPMIFRDGFKEIRLPVSPSSYTVGTSRHMEVVNIHELGDILLSGGRALQTIKLVQCLYPNNPYEFADDDEARPYIKQFDLWVRIQRRVRFMIGNTDINIPVKFESHEYGEKEGDGSNDIYADIVLRECPDIPQIQFQKKSSATKPRSSIDEAVSVATHAIVPGDTLSALCWKHYGSASKATWEAVAKYNNQPNPHLIPLGTVIKFPKPLP